ncbi:hypothetical protein D1872_111810 [compost metagenome]
MAIVQKRCGRKFSFPAINKFRNEPRKIRQFFIDSIHVMHFHLFIHICITSVNYYTPVIKIRQNSILRNYM